METSAEACWRLSKACGQWAVESRDSAARMAFRQMATAWARLAFNESSHLRWMNGSTRQALKAPRLLKPKSWLPLF